jgi:hypothetical protein
MVCFVVSLALSEYENFLQMTPYPRPYTVPLVRLFHRAKDTTVLSWYFI